MKIETDEVIVQRAMSILGKRGTGESKVRGDSIYYQRLSRKRRRKIMRRSKP